MSPDERMRADSNSVNLRNSKFTEANTSQQGSPVKSEHKQSLHYRYRKKQQEHIEE